MRIETHGHQDSRNYLLLNLHSNEDAAIEAALNFSKATGVFFVRLQNGGRKNIEGYFLDQKISFDPNQIYTDWGRKEHLKENKCWNKYLDEKVEQFSEFILNEIPHDKAIVSLRDQGGRTLRDYDEKRKLKKQVKALYRSALYDVSDYFITTDEEIFHRLKKEQLNVVLLHPKKVYNNGALAVYCARTKRPYIQIETKKGQLAQKQMMLAALDRIFK